jgi:molecular chaperone DnaK (HSP70)
VLEQAGIAPQTLAAEDVRMLLDSVRVAKEALSDAPLASLRATLSNGTQLDLTIDEAAFEAVTQALVQRTLGPTRKALRDAKVTTKEIKGVVLVGGATRMPVIRRAVEAFFGQPPLTNLNPDQVVALGAAIQADLLAGRSSRAIRRFRSRVRRISPPSRTARPRWRFTSCRANVSWCRTAARSRVSSCAAFRRWQPARPAFV